jgi:hypothetical protein
LTPWAAEFRYGATIDDELDRPTAVVIVDSVLEWAAKQLEVGF